MTVVLKIIMKGVRVRRQVTNIKFGQVPVAAVGAPLSTP